MAIKGRECYNYRCYTAQSSTRVVSRKRKFGAELDITRGTNFGIRLSASGNDYRMVLAGEGNERDVYTLTSTQYNSLVRNSVPYDRGYIPESCQNIR